MVSQVSNSAKQDNSETKINSVVFKISKMKEKPEAKIKDVCKKCKSCNLLTIKFCKECDKDFCVHRYGRHISTVHNHASKKHTKPRSTVSQKDLLIMHKSRLIFAILYQAVPNKENRSQLMKIIKKFKEQELPDEYAKYSKLLTKIQTAYELSPKKKTKFDYLSFLAREGHEFS